ncbi:hypothetical protein IAE55_31735 [Paenibacillus sp. S28]|nr:hypothetical protein [Paenibacillus sp. S28]
MNNVMKLALGLVGAVLIVLVVTCPNEEDYTKWLSSEHGIVCVNTGFDIGCKRQDAEVKWNSRYVMHAGIFIQVRDKYSEGNMDFVIKAFGIFNHFFDYSSNPK